MAIIPVTSDETRAPRTQVKVVEPLRKRNEVQEVKDDDAVPDLARPRRENRRTPAHLHDYYT